MILDHVRSMGHLPPNGRTQQEGGLSVIAAPSTYNMADRNSSIFQPHIFMSYLQVMKPPKINLKNHHSIPACSKFNSNVHFNMRS